MSSGMSSQVSSAGGAVSGEVSISVFSAAADGVDWEDSSGFFSFTGGSLGGCAEDMVAKSECSDFN